MLAIAIHGRHRQQAGSYKGRVLVTFEHHRQLRHQFHIIQRRPNKPALRAVRSDHGEDGQCARGESEEQECAEPRARCHRDTPSGEALG